VLAVPDEPLYRVLMRAFSFLSSGRPHPYDSLTSRGSAFRRPATLSKKRFARNLAQVRAFAKFSRIKTRDNVSAVVRVVVTEDRIKLVPRPQRDELSNDTFRRHEFLIFGSFAR
jgi:hypothetical protein